MTSIVSIVTAFMATFVLVFGYLTYVEEDVVAPDTDTPTATIDESER